MPIAWVTPPAKIETGFGAAALRSAPSPTSAESAPRTASAGTATFEVKGGIAPLQLFEPLQGRYIDVEAGYGMRYLFDSKRFQHGPHVGLMGFLPLSDNTRLLTGAQLQALITSAQRGNAITGHRESFRVGAEFHRFTNGPFADCNFSTDGGICGVGRGFGEAGMGLFLEFSHARYEQTRDLGFLVGVSVRIPTSVGAGFVVFNPSGCL